MSENNGLKTLKLNFLISSSNFSKYHIEFAKSRYWGFKLNREPPNLITLSVSERLLGYEWCIDMD